MFSINTITAPLKAFLIEIGENSINGDVDQFLDQSQVLIINIPPKLRGNSTENFVSKIENILPFIEKSGIKKVLFVSSTSVFSDENKVVTEETIPNPDSESGKQLLDCEKLLQENSHFETTILRFGGLIGEDRHPIYFLAGRTSIENPEAPVNLIHLEDCIGIILKIIHGNWWGETFNAVPSKWFQTGQLSGSGCGAQTLPRSTNRRFAHRSRRSNRWHRPCRPNNGPSDVRIR